MAKRRRRRLSPEEVAMFKRGRALYDKMLSEQDGHCALCPQKPSEKRRLDMDHDHKELYIRGLLCHRCNRNLPDWVTPEWLRAAAEYLEKGNPEHASG